MSAKLMTGKLLVEKNSKQNVSGFNDLMRSLLWEAKPVRGNLSNGLDFIY